MLKRFLIFVFVLVTTACGTGTPILTEPEMLQADGLSEMGMADLRSAYYGSYQPSNYFTLTPLERYCTARSMVQNVASARALLSRASSVQRQDLHFSSEELLRREIAYRRLVYEAMSNLDDAGKVLAPESCSISELSSEVRSQLKKLSPRREWYHRYLLIFVTALAAALAITFVLRRL